MIKKLFIAAYIFCCANAFAHPELMLGRAGHAFDHLGNIGEQGVTAARSGATIIYTSGLGPFGYQGLPPKEELAKQKESVIAYNKKVKQAGIKLCIGYVCATSIVKLETFDKNWPTELRSQFSRPPSEWRQIGRDGKPLPSWYGGDYEAACMNNPDWIAYEKFIVRQQMESEHDGIFFDNPTVHAQGCYCRFCMAKFSAFLLKQGVNVLDFSTEHLRKLADENPQHFRAFRCTIARDFLSQMRTYARDLEVGALITCNNSLNSPDAFFSQCRSLAYNIFELSKVEDWITIEDMTSQPRVLGNGQSVEYGAVYKQLQAISHDKPVVAVTIADGDYHTPPNLMRLALAEATANDASYLWWPTWPENEQVKMVTSFRSATHLLRTNENLFVNEKFRRDILLFSPFRRWNETDHCTACDIAATMTKSNLQYEIVDEEEFAKFLEDEITHAKLVESAARSATPLRKLKEQEKQPSVQKSKPVIGPILLAESASILNAKERSTLEDFKNAGGRIVFADQGDWMSAIRTTLKPSITLTAPSTVRAVVHDQRGKSIVHVYNLNIEKKSSFTDEIHMATNVVLKIRVPRPTVHQVRIMTSDENGTSGTLKFKTLTGTDTHVETTIPKLETSAIVIIQ